MTKIETLLKNQESLLKKNLPKIPENLRPFLKQVYARYEHFIEIELGEFERAEIEKDRQEYSYLLFPEENKLPVFDRQACLEYMHLKSGIPKVYCAVHMYHEYIDSVASGFVQGEAREQIEAEYFLTLDSIEKAQSDWIQLNPNS